MKILFLHASKYEVKDGLWAALNLLEKDGFEIERWNMFEESQHPFNYDFLLGWGAFGSPVDKYIQSLKSDEIGVFDGKQTKAGLCIGGTAMPPIGMESYDVLFYETEWYLPQIMSHKNAVHAFGINTDIYKPIEDAVPIWDWTSVGSFSLWKRHEKILEKGGYRLVIGEIQKENMDESLGIISPLLLDGVAISDMVDPEYLAKIYNSSEKVYIPADINGGGERAVLEARACGRPVEVEYDNPKLKELLTSPIWDEYYYFDQLKKGITSCF